MPMFNIRLKTLKKSTTLEFFLPTTVTITGSSSKYYIGTSLLVQWLRLHTPNVEGPGSIPGQGTRSHMPQLRVSMLQLRPSRVK